MTQFRWNAEASRYVDPRGRFVSRAAVKHGLDHAIRNMQAEMTAVSDALRNGGSLDAWVRDMRALTKDVNLYSAALAKGGWAQMTPSDYGRVGRRVRDQYAYLDRFAGDIASGYPLDGRFLARSRMYGQSGRPLFAEMVGEQASEGGAMFERNILGKAEHCAGCVGQTSRGLVPIGSLVPIGQRTCLSHCKCTIRYYDGDGDAV